MGLQERNERLFFRVLLENTLELLPIVDLPVVGAYCKSHGLMFRQPPRGLYIGLRDMGARPRQSQFVRPCPCTEARANKLLVVTEEMLVQVVLGFKAHRE